MSNSKEEYTTKDALFGFAAVIGAFIILCISIVYGITMNSILLYNFYRWFGMPVFDWLTPITFYQAVGLSVLISVFRKSSTAGTYNFFYKGEKISKKPIIWMSLIGPWVIFMVGYIVHILIK